MQVKVCTKCKAEKCLSDFPKDRHTPDGFCYQCKACRNAKFLEWKDANPEIAKSSSLRYRIENRDKELARYKKYDEENREKRAESQANARKKFDADKLAEKAEWQREYRKRNLERVRLNERLNHEKDRARRMGCDGVTTADEWEALCEKYGRLCICCCGDKPLVVDHVIPLAMGGSNGIENIQPLCGDCNMMKGARHIDFRKTWELAHSILSGDAP